MGFVTIIGSGSSFDALRDVIEIDVAAIERPPAAVLEQLMQVWQRNN